MTITQRDRDLGTGYAMKPSTTRTELTSVGRGTPLASGPAHNTTPIMDGPRRRWAASSSSKVLVTSFVLRPCQRRRMARPLPAERYEPAH